MKKDAAQPGNTPGGDEVDLMRLKVWEPRDPNPGNNKIKLTVTGGGAKLWKKATKEEALPLTNGAVEIAPADIKSVRTK